MPAAARAPAAPAALPSPAAPPGYAEFFHARFRDMVRTAMIAGATQQEAEDAASRTLADILARWTRDHAGSPGDPEDYAYPAAWARKLVVFNFIKSRTRGTRRVARRLIERGHTPLQEGAEDPRLTELEDEQWIAQVLSSLPPAQREVMECIARGLDRDEIPDALGKTKEAVRRSLCDARKRLAAELHPDGEARQPPPATPRAAGKET
jgi:DNA-directed RNA polymerase specialized sigma24 family protein